MSYVNSTFPKISIQFTWNTTCSSKFFFKTDVRSNLNSVWYNFSISARAIFFHFKWVHLVDVLNLRQFCLSQNFGHGVVLCYSPPVLIWIDLFRIREIIRKICVTRREMSQRKKCIGYSGITFYMYYLILRSEQKGVQLGWRVPRVICS